MHIFKIKIFVFKGTRLHCYPLTFLLYLFYPRKCNWIKLSNKLQKMRCSSIHMNNYLFWVCFHLFDYFFSAGNFQENSLKRLPATSSNIYGTAVTFMNYNQESIVLTVHAMEQPKFHIFQWHKPNSTLNQNHLIHVKKWKTNEIFLTVI